MTTIESGEGSRIPFRQVHLTFALLIPAATFAFWKTYVSIFNNLPDTVTGLIHFHALLMVVWLLMLVAQPVFIRTGKFAAHRWVGRLSFVVAPLIIWATLAVVYESFQRDPNGIPAEFARLNVLAFGQLLAFGVSWGLAITYRKRTPLHVRFMISSVFAIGTAIVFRAFSLWLPGFGSPSAAVAGNGVVLMLGLLVLIALDWRGGMKRSPFWVVTVLIGVMTLGYWTYARTGWWLEFCEWFAGLPQWVFLNTPAN